MYRANSFPSSKRTRGSARAKTSHAPKLPADLLALIDVIDQERRFNQTAAVLSSRSGDKKQFEWKAQRGAAALANVRHSLAQHGKAPTLSVSRHQIEAYITILLDIELDTGRFARATVTVPGTTP